MCEEWNTLVEETIQPATKTVRSWVSKSKPLPLAEIENRAEARFSTGITELDRVLGGGLVPGCLGLIGGDPGIGKSTLLLQVASLVAQREGKVLYVTGEESLTQLKLRAERLDAIVPDLIVLSEADTNAICDVIRDEQPVLVIVDSIQTMFVEEVSTITKTGC